jgi:hypothetical protein
MTTISRAYPSAAAQAIHPGVTVRAYATRTGAAKAVRNFFEKNYDVMAGRATFRIDDMRGKFVPHFIVCGPVDGRSAVAEAVFIAGFAVELPVVDADDEVSLVDVAEQHERDTFVPADVAPEADEDTSEGVAPAPVDLTNVVPMAAHPDECTLTDANVDAAIAALPVVATATAGRKKKAGPTGKNALLAELALRPEGATGKELDAATGWSQGGYTADFKAMATRFGYGFRTEKCNAQGTGRMQAVYFLTAPADDPAA